MLILRPIASQYMLETISRWMDQRLKLCFKKKARLEQGQEWFTQSFQVSSPSSCAAFALLSAADAGESHLAPGVSITRLRQLTQTGTRTKFAFTRWDVSNGDFLSAECEESRARTNSGIMDRNLRAAQKMTRSSKGSCNWCKSRTPRNLWVPWKKCTMTRVLMSLEHRIVSYAWTLSMMESLSWGFQHAATSSTLSAAKSGSSKKARRMSKDVPSATWFWKQAKWKRKKRKTNQPT